MFAPIVLYLLLINAATFGVFASDKQRAKVGGRRAPERVLLQMALIGGSVGAIAAQQMLRHKTRKEPFRTQLWMIVAVQLAALTVAVWARRH